MLIKWTRELHEMHFVVEYDEIKHLSSLQSNDPVIETVDKNEDVTTVPERAVSLNDIFESLTCIETLEISAFENNAFVLVKTTFFDFVPKREHE